MKFENLAAINPDLAFAAMAAEATEAYEAWSDLNIDVYQDWRQNGPGKEMYETAWNAFMTRSSVRKAYRAVAAEYDTEMQRIWFKAHARDLPSDATEESAFELYSQWLLTYTKDPKTDIAVRFVKSKLVSRFSHELQKKMRRAFNASEDGKALEDLRAEAEAAHEADVDQLNEYIAVPEPVATETVLIESPEAREARRVAKQARKDAGRQRASERAERREANAEEWRKQHGKQHGKRKRK